MINIDTLLARASALSVASGRSLTTLSSQLFGDGTRLSALADGKDMGVRRLARALPVLEALERQYGVMPLIADPDGDAAAPGPEASGPSPAGPDPAGPDPAGPGALSSEGGRDEDVMAGSIAGAQ